MSTDLIKIWGHFEISNSHSKYAAIINYCIIYSPFINKQLSTLFNSELHTCEDKLKMLQKWIFWNIISSRDNRLINVYMCLCISKNSFRPLKFF